MQLSLYMKINFLPVSLLSHWVQKGEKIHAIHSKQRFSLMKTFFLYLSYILLPFNACSADIEKTPKNNVCSEFSLRLSNNEEGLPTSAGVLTPDEIFSGVVNNGAHEYYQLCVPRHEHQHKILIKLNVLSGKADLYGSVDHARPQLGQSSWMKQNIKGSETSFILSLPTYLAEFPRHGPSFNIYISVVGSEERSSSSFDLSASIIDLKHSTDIKTRQEYYDKERGYSKRLRRAQEIMHTYNYDDL